MLNIVTIQGRLTKDPELRRTNSGKAVVSGSVACERDYKDDNGEKITDFIPFVVWGEPAERMSKYLSKGNMVILSGQLNPRKWKDKEGRDHVEPEVKVDRWHFGETKKKDNGHPDPYQGGYVPGNFGQPTYPTGYNGQPAYPTDYNPGNQFAEVDEGDSLPF